MKNLPQGSPRGIHEEGKDFDSLMRAFLLGKKERIAGDVLRFTWDSWCGTGAGEFHQTQTTFVFMSLLRERRLAEAVGVSFFVSDGPPWMREPGRPFDTWRSDFLKFCGFDPETLLLADHRIEHLAAAGSERAAQIGMATLRSAKEPHEKWPWDLEKLAWFLIPEKPEYWEDTDPRKEISADVQKQILDLLSSAFRDDLPFHELDELLKIPERLRRLETKDTLHRLLKHPSTTYAERAAALLRTFGEEIPPIPPAPPVRFRICLNGQPWRSAELNYTILHPTEKNMGSSGSLKTDADGFATIGRDEFLNPATRGDRMSVADYPSGGGNMWSKEQYNEGWVDAEIPVPRAFDEVTSVHLTACPLEIELIYPTPPPPAQRASAHFKLTKAGELDPNARGFSLDYKERMETPERIVLSTIAPGMYQLSVLVPGSARHVSDPFEVKAGMAPVKVKPEKGSHVYASIQMPQNARGIREIRLFKGDQDVTHLYMDPWSSGLRPLFAGCPKGSYQMRVVSTAEFMKKHSITKWEPPEAMWQEDMTKGVDCEGLTVDFVIDDTTPALLDLGRFGIKPIASMQGKAGPLKPLSLGLAPP